MGQRNHQKRMTRRLSHITPLESKEAFYTGKMGSWLTKKKTLSLKYVIINHVYHDELQKQLNAGFHKQNS